MFVTLCSGKHNVAVWPSSVCLSHRHTDCFSPGGSMRLSQHTFWPDSKEDQHTGWAKKVIPLVHYITLYERYHFFWPTLYIFSKACYR